MTMLWLTRSKGSEARLLFFGGFAASGQCSPVLAPCRRYGRSGAVRRRAAPLRCLPLCRTEASETNKATKCAKNSRSAEQKAEMHLDMSRG